MLKILAQFPRLLNFYLSIRQYLIVPAGKGKQGNYLKANNPSTIFIFKCALYNFEIEI